MWKEPSGEQGALLMEKVTGGSLGCLNRVLPCIWNLDLWPPVPWP